MLEKLALEIRNPQQRGFILCDCVHVCYTGRSIFMNKKLPLYDKRMTSKLDRTALKIAARTRLFRQPWSQKTVHWLRLLIALAIILTAVFASWAPHGLVLPVYYIVSLVLVIALPGDRKSTRLNSSHMSISYA